MNRAGADGAIAVPDEGWREIWKKRRLPAFARGENTDSVQRIAACGQNCFFRGETYTDNFATRPNARDNRRAMKDHSSPRHPGPWRIMPTDAELAGLIVTIGFVVMGLLALPIVNGFCSELWCSEVESRFCIGSPGKNRKEGRQVPGTRLAREIDRLQPTLFVAGPASERAALCSQDMHIRCFRKFSQNLRLAQAELHEVKRATDSRPDVRRIGIWLNTRICRGHS